MKLFYPHKLMILFPMHDVQVPRRVLTAIDDALVVHRHHPTGGFQFELRPMQRLARRGYARFLRQLAADLQADHIVVIVGRDAFLEELVRRACETASAGEWGAVELAAQVIAERTRYQIRDAVDAPDPQHEATQTLAATRPRRTRVEPRQRDVLNYRQGLPTPRAEMLWSTLAHGLLDPRTYQQARLAWERWADANRPNMPRHAV